MPRETPTSAIDRFKEAALTLPDPGRGRTDRREMGVPDPSRRASTACSISRSSRPGSGLPATSCPTGCPSWSPRGILERAPDPADKRRVIYSLTAKGEGAAAGGPRAAPMGRAMGLRQDCTSSLPTAATASRSARSASRRRTGASSSSSDLTWVERDGSQTALGRRIAYSIDSTWSRSARASCSALCGTLLLAAVLKLVIGTSRKVDIAHVRSCHRRR